MALAYSVDLTWVWVIMGLGAFLTVVATFIYAMTMPERGPQRRHQIQESYPDGSHEQLAISPTETRLHAGV